MYNHNIKISHSKKISMDIFGISLSRLKYDVFFQTITQKNNTQNIVFTPNPEILLLAKNDFIFAQSLKKAQYLLPDGIGLYIAYQILDSHVPWYIDVFLLPWYIIRVLTQKKELYKKYGERICWSDLTKDLLHFANTHKREIVVIDLYNPTDERKVASQKNFEVSLKKVYPDIQLFYYIWKKEDEAQIISDISNLSSPLLFSCLGMKKQEENVLFLMESCKNISFWMGVGGSFDYISGLQKRPPKVIRNLGFEWLYRLFFWPQKIKRIKRLYNAVLVFIYEVLKSK